MNDYIKNRENREFSEASYFRGLYKFIIMDPIEQMKELLSIMVLKEIDIFSQEKNINSDEIISELYNNYFIPELKKNGGNWISGGLQIKYLNIIKEEYY